MPEILQSMLGSNEVSKKVTVEVTVVVTYLQFKIVNCEDILQFSSN